MSTISIIFGSILLACALFLIVAVLLQDSQKGLSGAIAGGSDTYYGKNKGKSKQKKLSKLTAIASIVFVVIALATFIVGK
ncbi:MAG TPA: preprotein translocase subunit SecG [Clostridiales bacterium]|jgi:preprotein translocase subunit SecG|nr:preprotein translocase subunit SecG [Candidatus Apopatosoma intestinale]CCZ20138.1 protein translocase SecG subunit [Candidatus Apopatosoma intestinale]HBO65261.1 preprotein translocase subunit SecG [Candidatus Apopatosoma intestinale]